MTSKEKLKTWSWIIYDMGNSAYASVMITAYFILYFKSAIVKDVYKGDLIWGKMIGGSMLFLALITPALGAIADQGHLRKKLLIIFSFISILATAALALLPSSSVALSIVLFCISIIGYEAAITFYDSFLGEVSHPGNIGKISGLGFALGYLGGLLSIAMAYPFIASSAQGTHWSMAPLWIAVIQFFVCTLPAVFLLQEKPSTLNHGKILSLKQSVANGFTKLFSTLSELKKYRDLSMFLLGYLFFYDGIATVISFGGTFAKDTLGFKTTEVFLVFILSNLVAVPGSFIGGTLSDRFGAKKTILSTLIIWILTILALSQTQTKLQLYLVSCMVGLGLGSTQGAARSLYAQFIPKDEEARFFALKGLCGKAGTVLGPMVFGWVSYLTSNQRLAALSLIAFFILGFIFVWRVDENRGKSMGKAI